MLEAGPRVDRGAALDQFHRAAIKVPESPYPNTPFAPHPRSDAIDDYYVQGGPDKFSSTYLRQVGGTTWHWLGTTLRLVPDDFRLRSRFGLGVDWPIATTTWSRGIARPNGSLASQATSLPISSRRGASRTRFRQFP